MASEPEEEDEDDDELELELDPELEPLHSCRFTSSQRPESSPAPQEASMVANIGRHKIDSLFVVALKFIIVLFLASTRRVPKLTPIVINHALGGREYKVPVH